MSHLFRGQYRVESARATWHDYNGGVYFITICTAHKRCYFGYILDGETVYSPLGQFISTLLQEVHVHHSYADIPLYIVMPNHIHAIICIDNDPKYMISKETSLEDPIGIGKDMRQISKSKGLLPVVVGGIKSAATAYAHRNNINFAWQSRFHDRLIRNQEECNRISDYIEHNPLNWTSDSFYQSTL